MRALFILALGFPSIGLAQSANEASVTIGAGVQSAPSYFGADSNTLGATGSFSLEQFRFGDLSVGGGAQGLGYGASLRFISPRKASDNPELAGLEDIDLAFELGGGLRYAADGFDAFANLRYGFGGHESLVADLGANFVSTISPQLELRAGPRALWGSEDYARTYFGVTEAESLASNFDAYTPDSGLISAGVEARLTYQVTDDWGVTGTVRYDQLQGDAADSPIVQDKDQITTGLVLTRRVSFGF